MRCSRVFFVVVFEINLKFTKLLCVKVRIKIILRSKYYLQTNRNAYWYLPFRHVMFHKQYVIQKQEIQTEKKAQSIISPDTIDCDLKEDQSLRKWFFKFGRANSIDEFSELKMQGICIIPMMTLPFVRVQYSFSLTFLTCTCIIWANICKNKVMVWLKIANLAF